MPKQLIQLAPVLFLAIPSNAFAKDAKKPPAKPEYEQVVTAKRKPEPSFTSDRSVSAVNRKTLRESAPRTVPEALWDTPGVFVQETNYGGGSPILRGMIGPQVLLMFDGVRLNNSVYRTGPLQYLNLVDPSHLDRIEVLRGPGSVLYGSDAMGGVIQLVPLRPMVVGRPKVEHGGRLSYRYSSADQGNVVHGYNETVWGPVGGLVALTARNFNDLTGGRNIGRQPWTGYTQLSAYATAAMRWSRGVMRGTEASANYLHTQINDAGRTDQLYAKNNLQLYDNRVDLFYMKMDIPIRPIATRVKVLMSGQVFREVKDSLTLADDLATLQSGVRDRTVVVTPGVDLQFVSKVYRNYLWLQYGGMFYHDMVLSNRWTRTAPAYWTEVAESNFPGDPTYDNFGAFVTAGSRVYDRRNHRLELRAGYRFHGMRGLADPSGTLPRVDFTCFGHVAMGSIQYLYKKNATVAATFSQGFRAPNLGEAVMLGDTGKLFHVPNPDLEPERSDTVELLGRVRFWRIALGVSGFVSFIRDLIKREPTTWEGQDEINGKPVEWNVNGAKGVIFGAEGFVRFKLPHRFTFHANVAYARGDEWIPEAPDEPLTRIPPLFGYFKLRYDTRKPGRWSGFAETYVRWAARQDRLSAEDIRDIRIPPDGTPGWWTLNLRAGLTAFRWLRLSLTVENLLNKSYKYHASGIYAPGTNGILTAEIFY